MHHVCHICEVLEQFIIISVIITIIFISLCNISLCCWVREPDQTKMAWVVDHLFVLLYRHDIQGFVSRWQLGHKWQLAPRCRALGTMITTFISWYTEGCPPPWVWGNHNLRPVVGATWPGHFTPPLCAFKLDAPAPALSHVRSPNNGKVVIRDHWSSGC